MDTEPSIAFSVESEAPAASPDQKGGTHTPRMDVETFYRVFRDISRSVHSSDSLREVLDLAAFKTTRVLGAKGAFLRLHNEETEEFEVAAAYGMGKRYLAKGPVSADKILEDQVQPDQIHLITDILNAPRVQYPQEAWDEGIRMMLDVPLNVKGRMVGLIRIYLSEKRDFSEEELDLLKAVAEQCACAISKARSLEIQQARYNKLARQTDKLSSLGRMAAGIAHEINNPLAGILLYGSNIIKKTPEGTPVHRGLEVIIRETQRCKGIIEDLLEFSRDNKPRKSLADINQVLGRAVSILENEFKLHHIRLEKKLAEGLEPILLDENQMVQVFINLLLNAVQAVGGEGKVTIASWEDQSSQSVLVSVSDNGVGIDPDDLEKVFDPFFSTKGSGTGLGLSVSFGIVDNHHGEIDMVSLPQQGTRVTVRLPAIRREEQEAPF